MLRKYLLGFGAFALAFVILSVSVLQSSSVSYSFASSAPTAPPVTNTPVPEIIYNLPFQGDILPDSPFWIFKAMRDRVWYVLAKDPLKKAELALLFSDKRLESSRILFSNSKPDLALSTLTKGEKYLEAAMKNETEARDRGTDTSQFLVKLLTASLKHRQVIEENILPLAPEDAKPTIVQSEDYAKNTFKYVRDILNSKSIPVQENPFDGH